MPDLYYLLPVFFFNQILFIKVLEVGKPLYLSVKIIFYRYFLGFTNIF